MIAFKNRRNLPFKSNLDKSDILTNIHQEKTLPRNNSSFRSKSKEMKEKINMSLHRDQLDVKQSEGIQVLTLGYPDNYAYYLAKSSVFSKAGSNIINAKKHNYNSQLEIQKPNPMSGGTDQLINSLIVNMNNNFNLEMHSKIQDEKKDEAAFIGDTELLNKHVALWDFLLELECNVDNKIYIKNLVRRLLVLIHDEISTNSAFFDIFLMNNLNKAYAKCFKIVGVLLVYMTFLVTDFNYESNVKLNLKRIISGVNEFLIWMVETYILSNEENRINSVFIEKFKKLQKNHRARKGKDVVNIVIKNLDTVINTMRQFSK
jgi:hypothetical protein